MGRPKLYDKSLCHPDIPHQAKGLCQVCYKAKWFKQQPKKPYIKSYKRWELKAHYGLDEKTYLKLRDMFDGCCHLCRKVASPLCVDHCHDTGVVRGLLCNVCNRSLGHYEKMLKMDHLSSYLKNNVAQGKKGPYRGRTY